MLPELEDLAQRELFSQPEIKSIIKKRRDFEYTLKRRKLFRVDYLRCIQYEIRLDLLRRKRKKRLGTRKLTLSDHAVTRRIHGLYNRALRRFKTDVILWAQYINFCKSSGAQKQLGRVYASALQANPTSVSLWIDAAAWEYEGNQNMLNARALMQQGLRFNDESQQMWSEYLRLELLYIRQIKSRQVILGVDPATQGEGRAAFLQGIVAGVVYDNAIQQFPADLEFRVGLVRVVHEFQGVEELLDKMYASIAEDFGDKVECYVALANRYMLGSNDGDKDDALKNCVSVFENGLSKLEQSDDIWEAYSDMLLSQLRGSVHSGEPCTVMQQLLGLFSRAESEERASPALYCKWIEVLTKQAQLESAASVCERALAKHTVCSPLWEHRFKLLLMRSGCSGMVSGFEGMLREAVQAMQAAAPPDALKIMQIVIHSALAHSSDASQLTSLEESISTLGPDAEWMQEAYLRWAMTQLPVPEARAAYRTILRNSKSSEHMFQLCITFEKAQATRSEGQISKLYDEALRAHGNESVGLWTSLIMEKLKEGDAIEVGKLHFRAKKALGYEINMPLV